jgi:hypothetical protein
MNDLTLWVWFLYSYSKIVQSEKSSYLIQCSYWLFFLEYECKYGTQKIYNWSNKNSFLIGQFWSTSIKIILIRSGHSCSFSSLSELYSIQFHTRYYAKLWHEVASILDLQSPQTTNNLWMVPWNVSIVHMDWKSKMATTAG